MPDEIKNMGLWASWAWPLLLIHTLEKKPSGCIKTVELSSKNRNIFFSHDLEKYKKNTELEHCLSDYKLDYKIENLFSK